MPAEKPPSSIEDLREDLLKQHGACIMQALQRVFTGAVQLVPAPLSQDVKIGFLQQCSRSGCSVLPAFHGTKAANHPSIFSKGLMVPTAASGVNVSNGSAHGLGVYTAKLGNPYLSRGFCSEPRMLVCAVADDAVPLAAARPLGRFFVTAESSAVRHVGDAVVVMDPRHVVPLFEAAGEGFATPSSFVPTAAVPAKVATVPATPVPTSPPTASAVRRKLPEVAARPRRKKAARAHVLPQMAELERFLARRAVQRRLSRGGASTLRR